MSKDKSSDDPKKKLTTREENELLKLKLSAEHGAEFGETDPDLLAEAEHEFLNYI